MINLLDHNSDIYNLINSKHKKKANLKKPIVINKLNKLNTNLSSLSINSLQNNNSQENCLSELS